ncbi:MAG: AAA+ superfamily predicted ATPase, partial [Myxococcota bacterium]
MGYPDHLALLEDHLGRLERRLRATVLRRRQHDASIGGMPLVGADAEDLDPDILESDADKRAVTIARRISETDRGSVSLPLLDLQDRFGLDAFELDVVLLALAPSLDLRFNRYYALLREGSLRGELDVDGILGLLGGGLSERIRLRRYFAPDAPLVQHHVIALDRHRIELGDSFLSLGVRLPQRVLGWLLGEDNLDAALQGFSKLIDPDVRFDQVVLAEGVRESIEAMVQNHAEYVETLKEWRLDERITYGRGVVLLFVGAPGTGKTMTAKAVASQLNKRLLLVDPQQIFDMKRPVEDNLADLFREARLQNAVVFFDECEGLLGHRATGNPQVSVVLSAIEHYDGVVVLSTNMPHLLDEALDRRVLYRVVFEAPSVTLRRRIWELHLPDTVPVNDDVDVETLARQFDFTGGYIKNAVLVALHRALSRPERPAQLTAEDLLVAARTQLRARLSEFAERTPTTLRLEDLVLPEETSSQIGEILAAARSRSTVFQEWGFGAKLNKGRGLSALFDG